MTYEDLAEWEPTVEEPITLNYNGLDVFKCPTWTQGPVFLQQLALLDGFDLKKMNHNSPEYIHTLIECAKLAFADREVYYGDPRFDDVPFDVLLSRGYNAKRRELIGREASMELRPGDAGKGIPDYATFDVRADNRHAMGLPELPKSKGNCENSDTTQLDVIDAEGNMVAATPSGGWISSSPLIKGVGFPMGTRGQMFYLNRARPNALEPHKRPRATLTPTIVTKNGEPKMAFGMRGGDIQDQYTLQFFLNHVIFGMEVQAALDAPCLYTMSFPNSFYPRTSDIGSVYIEPGVNEKTLEELRKRGHKVGPTRGGSNRMGILIDKDRGIIQGGVCSSGEQAYAFAW